MVGLALNKGRYIVLNDAILSRVHIASTFSECVKHRYPECPIPSGRFVLGPDTRTSPDGFSDLYLNIRKSLLFFGLQERDVVFGTVFRLHHRVRSMIRPLDRRGTWRTYSTTDGLPGVRIEHIAEDGEGYLWFATWENGASRFDGDEFRNFVGTGRPCAPPHQYHFKGRSESVVVRYIKWRLLVRRRRFSLFGARRNCRSNGDVNLRRQRGTYMVRRPTHAWVPRRRRLSRHYDVHSPIKCHKLLVYHPGFTRSSLD